MTTSEWKPVEDDIPCRRCGVKGRIMYCIWESSDGAHEDAHYKCEACGKDWWVDGPDY